MVQACAVLRVSYSYSITNVYRVSCMPVSYDCYAQFTPPGQTRQNSPVWSCLPRRCELDFRQLKAVGDRKFEVWTRSERSCSTHLYTRHDTDRIVLSCLAGGVNRALVELSSKSSVYAGQGALMYIAYKLQRDVLLDAGRLTKGRKTRLYVVVYRCDVDSWRGVYCWPVSRVYVTDVVGRSTSGHCSFASLSSSSPARRRLGLPAS